jgi:2,3-bisphosphoglycerate-independent phosphoglycerate mutase
VVAVLLIVDGASEPVRLGEATSLERAATPLLDSLCADGRVSRLATVPGGLPVGSETAIPGLLGWTPDAPVDRGAVEAAAHALVVEPGEHAWRVDVVRPSDEDWMARRSDQPVAHRASAEYASRAAAVLASRLPRHVVHPIGGHRLLVRGPLPLPSATFCPGFRTWPRGVVPPRVLDESTVMVSARGAAAGIARLMGARVVVPDGATGQPLTNPRGKAAAAVAAIGDGAERVVVHVGGPDEAAHMRDADAKVAAIERVDIELLPALVTAVERVGGTLRVCPDHGCDPRTGAHDATPVPCLDWAPSGGLGNVDRVPDARLTERFAADLAGIAA